MFFLGFIRLMWIRERANLKSLRSVHTRRQVAATRRGDRSLRVYRSATSCSHKVRRHVAATNRFVCTGEFLWKSLSPQQNFVAATSRIISNQTESVRLVAATESVAATKIFTKILQYTRSDLSLQRVAATCCCNLSPSVYRPLSVSNHILTENRSDGLSALTDVYCGKTANVTQTL